MRQNFLAVLYIGPIRFFEYSHGFQLVERVSVIFTLAAKQSKSNNRVSRYGFQLATAWLATMADTILLRSLKAQPKQLNLSNKKLAKVPKIIAKFTSTTHIELKNNKLQLLPNEFGELLQVPKLAPLK